MKLQKGQLLAGGKYTLVRLLGEGGHGQVWEAWQRSHKGFHKPVVLKFQLFSPTTSADEKRKQELLERMFLNEARLAARLHHQNIVEIYDLGQEQTFDFIAMERIPGKDLSELLAAHHEKHGKPLPWELVAQIMMQICKGLYYAHTQTDEHGQPLRLIHRDLKPANILLTYEGVIKIIDFGIAKASTNLGKTKTGMVKGTPYYMAPEQIRNPQGMDARVDLYALGVMLYELCTGQRPFERDEQLQLMYAILSEPAPPVCALNPGLPKEFSALIMRLLEKEPGARLQDAAELRKECKGLLQTHGEYPDQDDLRDLYLSLFPKPPALTPPPNQENTQSYGVATPTPIPQETLPLGTPTPPGIIQPSTEVTPKPATSQPIFAGESVSATSTTDILQEVPTTTPKKHWVALGALVFLLVGAAAWVWGPFANDATLPSKSTKSLKPGMTAAASPRPATRRRSPAKAPARKKTRAATPRPRPARRPSPQRVVRRRRPRVARAPARQKPCQRGRFGWAMLTTTPKCQLSREGTPYSGGWLKLRANRKHIFRCRNYRKAINASVDVRVKPCQRKEVKKRLRLGQFQVISQPWATIVLKGKGSIEQQRWYSNFYEGEYTLVLYKEGKVTDKKILNMRLKAGKRVRCVVQWRTNRAWCR